MPIFKYTFKFNQLARGFSESWYADFPDLETAAEGAETLAQYRAALLARDVTFEATEVTADTDETLGTYFSTRCLNYPHTALPGDITAAGCLVEFRGERSYHRSSVLRGVPDAWIIRNADSGRLMLTPAAAGLIDNFLEQLDTGELVLKIRRRVNDAGGAVRVTGVAAITNAIDQTELTVPDDWPFPPLYGRVILSGARKSARVLNGTQLVTQLTSATAIRIALPYGRLVGLDLNDIANLMIRTPVRDYVPIVDAFRSGIRTRKSGRAFFVPRGRQPNRRK